MLIRPGGLGQGIDLAHCSYGILLSLSLLPFPLGNVCRRSLLVLQHVELVAVELNHFLLILESTNIPRLGLLEVSPGLLNVSIDIGTPQVLQVVRCTSYCVVALLPEAEVF
ncbi:hypothetical protein D3C84_973600 [compost metagenome]